MESVIVHYQEIALKGRNRPWFIEQLVSNLRVVTADLGVTRVRPLSGRLELTLDPGADWAEIRRRISRTFGIANFLRARRTGLTIDEISAAILDDLAGLRDLDGVSFRVTARRSDKAYPFTSPEIEREVGGRIKACQNWKVDPPQPRSSRCHRNTAERGLLLREEASWPRRSPFWHERSCPELAVWWDRFHRLRRSD